MKKRLLFLLIIPLSLLILVGGGLGIFRYATQGKLYTADGLQQNDRCYHYVGSVCGGGLLLG